MAGSVNNIADNFDRIYKCYICIKHNQSIHQTLTNIKEFEIWCFDCFQCIKRFEISPLTSLFDTNTFDTN